jgi:hypothetical protein
MTRDQQIENLILAAWRWNEVKPRQVVRELNNWRCGTQACFGGHLGKWSEFRRQGLCPTAGGYPQMPSLGIIGSAGVARQLFGNYRMFNPIDFRDIDRDTPYRASAWTVVRNRIEAQFAALSESA